MVDGVNYQILRTGCWPYIKYHCTVMNVFDCTSINMIIRVSKLFIFPACPAYGLAAFFLLQSRKKGTASYTFDGKFVNLYFLLDEGQRGNEFKI